MSKDMQYLSIAVILNLMQWCVRKPAYLSLGLSILILAAITPSAIKGQTKNFQLTFEELAIDKTFLYSTQGSVAGHVFIWQDASAEISIPLHALGESPCWDLKANQLPPLGLLEAIDTATRAKDKSFPQLSPDFRFQSAKLLFSRVSDDFEDIRWFWFIQFARHRKNHGKDVMPFIVLMNRKCIEPILGAKMEFPDD